MKTSLAMSSALPPGSGFSWHEPATTLLLLAEALGRPVDPQTLHERFASAEAPRSLLTLVQQAEPWGITMRAFRAESLEALEEATLPVVLHVQSPLDDTDQGFALLVGRDRQGFLFAGEGGLRWRLERGEVDRLWTGILAAPTLTEGAGSLSSQPLPAPALEDPGLLARRLALGGMVALAGFGALRLAGISALAGLVWVGLAVVGLLTGRALSSRARSLPVAGAGVCMAERPCAGGGGFFGCDGALYSRWASPFGFDLSGLGLAFFTASLAVMAVGALLPAGTQRAALIFVALAYALAMPVSLLLIGVQIYPLRRLCALCLAAHAAVLAGAAAGGVVVMAGAPAWPLVEVAGFGVLFALAFVGAYGTQGPFAALSEGGRTAGAQLGFIAASTTGGLGDWLGRPPLGAPLPSSPFLLGETSAALRVDAVVDPSCPACHNVVDDLARLVESHPEDVSVHVHLPTREARDPASRALRVALTAAGTPAAFQAARDRSADMHALAAKGEGAVLEHLGLPADRLPAARAAQAAADQLAALVNHTTPTLLVEGRRWIRPLWELALALALHRGRLGLPEELPPPDEEPAAVSDEEPPGGVN